VNLQQLRDAIRAQLDMDSEELPNALLDSYLQEGYTRTISMENRWPFFESAWTATSTGDTYVPVPANCNTQQIISLTDQVTGVRLMQIAPELAEDNFASGVSVTQPVYYTIWGNQITLWPNYSGDPRDFTLRGYRLQGDWMIGGASGEVDADPRLHQLLVHYAIGLAYAQQEDEVLEDVYMKRWQASYLAAHNAICSPRHHRPLIMNGGLPYVPGYTPVQWNLPT
jgi:hypothetical protein